MSEPENGRRRQSGMHRSYQPITPAANKLLQKRWDTNYYQVHRQRVKAAHSYVDTKPPLTYMHLHLKLKKLQLEEDRLALIERDNRLLLEKMAYIMRTEGRIDNRNDGVEFRSLNREKRMRELLRVASENQDIVRRITRKKAEYDRQVWEKDWKRNLDYMDAIAQFPKDWWKDEQFAGRPLKCLNPTFAKEKTKVGEENEEEGEKTSSRSSSDRPEAKKPRQGKGDSKSSDEDDSKRRTSEENTDKSDNEDKGPAAED